MLKGKNVLTTGQVAKICNVAPRTVSKWFDTGQLKGYRIPGSKDRRIPFNELINFMKVNNIPTSEFQIDTNKIRILIVENNNNRSSVLANIFQTKPGYEVQIVRSNFETGLTVQKFAPHVLLISLLSADIDARDICKNIRIDKNLQNAKIVAIANQLSGSESNALMEKGFDGYISDWTDSTKVTKAVEEALGNVSANTYSLTSVNS